MNDFQTSYPLSYEEIQNLLIERHGVKRQKKIAQACVGIAGLGGLGSHVAVLLTRLGVQNLILADFDKVDKTNLHRQQYNLFDIGQPKTKALHKHLTQINPYINYTLYTEKLNPQNIPDFFSPCSIICEAFDKAEEKAMLTETVLTELPTSVLVASSGMAGIKSPNSIVARKKMHNFYLCGDEKSDVEKEKTLYAPRVSLCASMQATVITQIILDEIDLSF